MTVSLRPRSPLPRHESATPPVFDRSLVQVLLGALVYLQLHLGRPWPRPVVERHAGRIGVESEPGRGTALFLTLPAISEA